MLWRCSTFPAVLSLVRRPVALISTPTLVTQQFCTVVVLVGTAKYRLHMWEAFTAYLSQVCSITAFRQVR